MKLKRLPNKLGYFGAFGGRFIPETLMWPLEELARGYQSAQRDKRFRRTLKEMLRKYVGRPTPLYEARRLSQVVGRGTIYLKREDLCLTGAHKINNTVGQVLLARRMDKKRIIAETGAGQHGVATATACALMGLPCEVYMGTEDMKRQSLNVTRMKLLGARVVGVTSGSRTLKDACNEAIRDWVTNVRSTHYVLGSVVGPHPYPMIVRDFQSVIGQEARAQILKEKGRLPNILLACVGGGSNSMGLFAPFFKDRRVRFIGVEAAGKGLGSGEHSASLATGSVGVLHGSMSYLLQDANGQIKVAHSISAGLDYPGVGPEHAYYKKTGRARYVSVTDREALEGFRLLSETEGLIPALESAHAIQYLMKMRRQIKKNDIVIVCLSGRGDKDVEVVEQAFG